MESGSQEEMDRRKCSSVACQESDRKTEATENPPEQGIPIALSEQQLPGKPKKTPFKFFGGRRSICTLPSFFSGRSKGHGKGASKKSISKSKTHDGIIDVTYESRKRGSNSTCGETGSPQQETTLAKILPNSRSAHLALDTGHKLDFSSHETLPLGSSEGFDKKLNEDKSLSFPRPKKGLKGLLSSIRRHKKNKNLDLEKVEPCEFMAVGVNTEQVIKSPEMVSSGTSETIERNSVNTGVTTICTSNSDGKGEDQATSEEVGKISNSQVINELHREAGELATDINEIGSPVAETARECICTDSEHNGIANIRNTDDNDMPSVHSTDHISLVFSDVTSLKSFDSFTGCGDIIADQDIESIAESTSSIERSRETTKRSSCLMAYQGGGEDMATPDEIEEDYLQQLWESATEADVSYEREPLQAMNDQSEIQAVSNQHVPPGSCKDVAHSCVEGTVVTVDLTPQSDLQESVPNSDEGYYDSTTPGPEDEASNDHGHDIKERLPRDSYSGDALYEFYEPDDSLSPPPIGEVFFDSKAPSTELFEHYLDFGLSVDKNLSQVTAHNLGVMETEEERLAAIQKQLLYWEMKREPLFTRSEHPTQEYSRQKQNADCKNGSANIVARQQIYLDNEQVASQNSSRSDGNVGFSSSDSQSPHRRGFQSVHCSEKCCRESCSQKAQGKCLNYKTKNSTFDSYLDETGLATQGHSGLGQTNTVKCLNYRNVNDHDNCRKKEYIDVVENNHTNSGGNKTERECEQVISFSQALVDFTSNGTLFSSLSESLGSSDSGSSFTQNLQALPTMVTFDIVDVENEGECDQQMDMNSDEEVAASFETFDSSCVHKESVAECDTQIFPMRTQNAFQNCTWGVASLPRHLSLYQLNPSSPSPLSLNRRSRSLDTESLELELANMYLSKSDLKSCELSAKQEDKKDFIGCEFSSCEESVQPFYSERTEADRIGSYYCSADLPPDGVKGWGGIVPDVLEKDLHRSVQPETDTQKQEFDRRPQHIRASNPIPLSPRQVVRPSHLPLRTNGRQSQEGSDSHRYYGERKLALVLPLDERKGVSWPHGLSFSQSSEIPVKFKPIGVTQGMPQSNAATLKQSANYVEHFESSRKAMLKGRTDHEHNLSGRWPSSYGECNALNCDEEGCS